MLTAMLTVHQLRQWASQNDDDRISSLSNEEWCHEIEHAQADCGANCSSPDEIAL